ncbi:MAG: phosphoglucosamine mutase [Pyrinomonadaceae bacterium]
MKRLFGTDGIRGKAGVFPLDQATIAVIGRSLAEHLREKTGENPRFVIGRDTRESGNWIEEAFCSGANSVGGSCQTAGVITTPGVAFLTRTAGFDAGIVISASHNPFEDNGIKIFSPSGRKLNEETERLIEKDIFEGAGEGEIPSAEKPDSASVSDFQKSYLDYLSGEFKGLSLKNFKMVMDCANGASSELAPRLFRRFDAETVVINNRPDGRNINHNCGSLHLESLQQKVLEEKADFGVAFDGDADRSLFVDERGRIVDGDAVLWVMARHLKALGQLKNNTIIATVMSNLGLEVALKSADVTLLRTQVGDKYVLEELLRTNSSVGGEQSGHIIFPDKSLVGDGMFTALYLLEALRSAEKKLSEMTAGFMQFPQILVNIKVREKIPFGEVPKIDESARRIEAELGDRGRLLLRYSGTENLARVMIEGENQREIEDQAGRLAGVIEESLG